MSDRDSHTRNCKVDLTSQKVFHLLKDIINVIDIFAGPGGLSEGFASYRGKVAFDIRLSVEKEFWACETLRRRKVQYIDETVAENVLAPVTRSRTNTSLLEKLPSTLANDVSARVCQATLGEEESDLEVKSRLRKLKLNDRTVLIGGPPCQAYSAAGKSRNKGKYDYDPLKDHRNFLYREYLRMLVETRPAVFVMENVKGLLSTKINGHPVFESILHDLQQPQDYINGLKGPKYRVHSLVTTEESDSDLLGNLDLKPIDYLVKAEEFGVPQARHRIILLGVREDLNTIPNTLQPYSQITTQDALDDLPHLRAGTTGVWLDDFDHRMLMSQYAVDLFIRALELGDTHLASYLESILEPQNYANKPFVPAGEGFQRTGFYNHESRNHMPSDLKRYLFISAFTKVNGVSPKGPDGLNPYHLAPEHKNWDSGKFADRFRCQNAIKPSTTITSHSGKDGHYFIHYDPLQCRSLTVREAARLQTFPDTYIFEGPVTRQYQQVGNAVPVRLAQQIAGIVSDILTSS